MNASQLLRVFDAKRHDHCRHVIADVPMRHRHGLVERVGAEDQSIHLKMAGAAGKSQNQTEFWDGKRADIQNIN